MSPRPVSPQEMAVLRAALREAAVVPDAERFLDAVGNLTVVGRCECGCDTVTFAVGSPESHPIADGIGKTAAGGTVGVLVFATEQELACLEVYDLGAGQEDLRLPDPASIRRWEEHRVG